jgi:hypothetical protein
MALVKKRGRMSPCSPNGLDDGAHERADERLRQDDAVVDVDAEVVGGHGERSLGVSAMPAPKLRLRSG